MSRLRLLFAVLIIGLWPSLSVGLECPELHNGLLSKGYQQITVSTTAVGLTVAKGATVAVVVVEAESIRYRDDGPVPTSAIGMLVGAPAAIQVCAAQMLTWKAIAAGTSDAVISIQYYGS